MERRELGKWIKRALWRAPGVLLGDTGRAELPLDFGRIRSVLIIRPDRLGDLVLSTPAYESIKLSFPWVETVVLANRSSAGILADNPFVDRVIPFDKKKPLAPLWDLARGKFDLAIALNRVFSATAAAFAFLSGAKSRVGYKTPEGLWVYNVPVEGRRETQHEIQNNLDLLRAIGVPRICATPRVYFNDAETRKIGSLIEEKNRFPERPLVLVKPGTRVPAWGWRLDKFQTTSRRLLETGRAEVFVVQGPGEKDMLNSLFPQNETNPIILPPLSAKELALLIQRSALLFCNHTGVMHLASATRTPVVAVFKHGEIARWGPYNTPHIALEERGGDALPPEKALDAIERLLNDRS